MHQKTFTESESTITGHGSPEYLPPSAKMQRLADKEKRSLTEGCTESRVCHELKSSQATCTASMEKTAAEKLTLIREQEEKIEELMVLLESNVKRGQRIHTMSFSFQTPLRNTFHGFMYWLTSLCLECQLGIPFWRGGTFIDVLCREAEIKLKSCITQFKGNCVS